MHQNVCIQFSITCVTHLEFDHKRTRTKVFCKFLLKPRLYIILKMKKKTNEIILIRCYVVVMGLVFFFIFLILFHLSLCCCCGIGTDRTDIYTYIYISHS